MTGSYQRMSRRLPALALLTGGLLSACGDQGYIDRVRQEPVIGVAYTRKGDPEALLQRIYRPPASWVHNGQGRRWRLMIDALNHDLESAVAQTPDGGELCVAFPLDVVQRVFQRETPTCIIQNPDSSTNSRLDQHLQERRIIDQKKTRQGWN